MSRIHNYFTRLYLSHVKPAADFRVFFNFNQVLFERCLSQRANWMRGAWDLWIGVRHLKNENQYLPMVHQRVHKIQNGWRKHQERKSERKKQTEMRIAGCGGYGGEIVKANKPFRWKWGHAIQTKAKRRLCIVTMAIRSETERQDRETCEIRPQRISVGPSYRLKNFKSFFLFKSSRRCRSHRAPSPNNQGNWITLHLQPRNGWKSIPSSKRLFPPSCLLGYRPHESTLSFQDTSKDAQHVCLWSQALKEIGAKNGLNRAAFRNAVHIILSLFFL